MHLNHFIDPPPSPASPSPAAPQLSAMVGGTQSYAGPWIVLLGGERRGIYEQIRPSQTAMYNYKPLLPVVVTCACEDDAIAIQELNDSVFGLFEENDNHSMIYHVERLAPSIRMRAGTPIYAIRAGAETGIWAGFEWNAIAHQIEAAPPAVKPVWCRPLTITEAIVYMLKKPGYTLPLLPSNTPVPPPPVREKPAPQPQTPRDDPGTESPPATPTKPTKSRKSPQTPAPPQSASRTQSTSRAKPSSSAKVASSSKETPSRSARAHHRSDKRRGTSDASSVDERLAAALESGLAFEVGGHILEGLVRPPPSMMNTPKLPLYLGRQAEEFLLQKGASNNDILTVLQAAVHCGSVEKFAYHLGLSVGWSAEECRQLWEVISLPGMK